MKASTRPPFEIGSFSVKAGTRSEIELPVALTVTGSPLSLPVRVFHGASDGPTIWMSAAIHGDELNGIEIIRRVMTKLNPRTLAGTVIAVPVVNLPGFVAGTRYLPDRRDLNRLFPGSARGSLGSRIANLFMNEIVSRCTFGIDLHTGSAHRTNLPQIRCNLDDEQTARFANSFGAPVLLHASIRDGSLRQAAAEAGAAVLLYEAGEAWRFDSESIRIGVRGVLRVLADLEMIDPDPSDIRTDSDNFLSRSSKWVRARRSGVAQLTVSPGDSVSKGQIMGELHNTFGHRLSRINAPITGVVIGLNLDPIVNQGDAMVHIAAPLT